MLEYFLIAVAVACAHAEDYCNLCKGHIACNNYGLFSSTCAADRELFNISSHIDAILSQHNSYRNRVAAGNLAGLSPVVRMGTMLWDEDLAYFAELNVKQCQMRHDQCRNTSKFKWAGQNLYWVWITGYKNPQTIVGGAIWSWFNEYKGTNMKNINKGIGGAGNFAPIVNDRSIGVGCALLRQSKNGGNEWFFVCNYSQNNVIGAKVYASGPSASKCKTKNPNYPALCGPDEKINPNAV